MYNCGFCKNCISKGQYSVSCVLCKNYFHLTCANKSNTNVTTSEVENIKSKKAGLVYRCGACTTSPPNVQADGIQLILEKLAGIEASNKQLADKFTALETKVDDAVKQLSDVKTDVTNCFEKVEKLESEAVQKFQKLEMENDELRRTMNRCDIVINGLPSNMSNTEMRNAVLTIGKKYSADFSDHDITFCSFINRKRAVLIKISNTGKRDEIIKNYRSAYDLKASDVMALDIHSRIYLNDNCTKLESKVRYVCRSLQRAKTIRKFKISYGGGLKVLIFGPDGKEKELRVEKILAYHQKNISQAELFLD